MGRTKVLDGEAKPINLRIAPEHGEWLKQQARREDRSVSGVVRRLITEERERIAASQGEEKS